MKTDEQFMQSAINKAKEGIKQGQTPFGACIVKDGEIISCLHNLVFENMDITAHAEICAIRETCRRLRTIDLSGCIIYSTCEPCPMCFSACHWARISRIVYGARIEDARQFGFNELEISNEVMKQIASSPVEITVDFLRQESLELFRFWGESGQKAY
ncbi:tRNA-specific adenosine deaminase [Candidatus Desantisbacteria bacterium CG2_30_40_21]|uniref:Nucleoside deaminase n=5 Tax=unclassified Candidatus Desantisiibacteriota TaxID=3106372 RepID=A0A2M7JD36_9BACT|nr:MAG: tRNA-specific adenosine deaminase [Candidatus Desantisbacteria bacterium CG2_30_40_21]PIP41931.1 MAG: tRNA-specific adenosine deaminase [Candidatus Desantisbacteria bacterium CG23_combo_of_CG06-09_8_20_14_all_40_23]PIX17340.1 MAG: nucleoside deaminase [Candidatus Desantisbacteria bacterium CG_4_8_14_3_um_filter_40_12]PIY19778.1 MAG: nucleoside deaminase [Candidatus Desantisbacteria bacterium CG_4_10_14_3_um_filter_40_18]PJB28686.1 MAG: nucleoside deaminase [Candidatus Desantisbacteria b